MEENALKIDSNDENYRKCHIESYVKPVCETIRAESINSQDRGFLPRWSEKINKCIHEESKN